MFKAKTTVAQCNYLERDDQPCYAKYTLYTQRRDENLTLNYTLNNC